jgi:uncharacterized phage-associated protein
VAGDNVDKLREVVVYFVNRANNVHLGVVKLMKLLYYADFDHCEQYGEPITGARYVKLDNGPALDGYESLLRDFEKEGAFKSIRVPAGPYERRRFVPLREPNLAVFSAEELDTLDKVCEEWRLAPLSRIIHASHNDVPWKATPRIGDAIDYGLAAYRHPQPADEDDAIAAALARDSTVREYAEAMVKREGLVRGPDE